MPRVSVIVAAHNAAGTLAETLASVAAQTYPDWEVVVCDDGSADATGDVARSALGDRVTVVRNERPTGPGGARNTAVAAARGELLATLDADDLWLPEFLETQVGAYDRAVAAGVPVGLVSCDARFETPGGEVRGSWFQTNPKADPVTVESMLHLNTVFTCVLCPVRVWRELGGQDPALKIAQDYDLWLRIVESGRSALVTDRILAVYRVAESGISANTTRLASETAEVLDRALARGELTRAQRRIARRQRRLQALVAERAAIAHEREAGRPVIGRRLRLLPRLARVAIEHPERWLGWLRGGPRAAGRGRHGG